MFRKKNKTREYNQEEGAYLFECLSKMCDLTFSSRWERDQHVDTCELFSQKEGKNWGRAGTNLDSFNVTTYKRRFPQALDDNVNNLHPARWLPTPSSWTVAHASQPVEAVPTTTNYPLKR